MTAVHDLPNEAAVEFRLATPADIAAKLVPLQAPSDEFQKLLTRTWTRIKTGQ